MADYSGWNILDDEEDEEVQQQVRPALCNYLDR